MKREQNKAETETVLLACLAPLPADEDTYSLAAAATAAAINILH